MEREDILTNIERNFHLSQKEADIGLALLEERAKSLHFDSVEAYVSAYYPKGFSIVDENLSDEEKGFIKYFKKDTQSLIIATKNSDFQTFLRASASTFRRQLSGELKTKCEKAFGVLDGKWTYEKSLQFAIGFEEYIQYRFAEKDKKDIYEKTEKFTECLHNRLNLNRFETNQILEVYDALFTNEAFQFDRKEFENIADKILTVDDRHIENKFISLRMTPPIFQNLGFDRLPLVVEANVIRGIRKGEEFRKIQFDIANTLKNPKKAYLVPENLKDTQARHQILETVRFEDDDNFSFDIRYLIKSDGRKNIISFQGEQLSDIPNDKLETVYIDKFGILGSYYVEQFEKQKQNEASAYYNQQSELFSEQELIRLSTFDLFKDEPSLKAEEPLSYNDKNNQMTQVAKDAIQTVNAQVSDLLLSYSDIKKLILNYGETNPKDIRQIQEVIFKSNYTDNGVPVSANHVIDVLGKDDFLRLIRRSAFHMSDTRENDDHLIIVDSGNIFEEDYTIHNNRYVTLTEKENFRYTENIEKIFNKRVSDVFNTYRDKIKSGKIKSSVGEVIFEGAVNNETIQLAAQAIVAEIDKSQSNEHTSHTNMAETPAQESTTTGNQEPNVEKQIQDAFKFALENKTDVLQETELSRDNWNKYFPDGKVETPIETVKLGKNQFEKLQQTDREYLLDAMYKTLTKPSIVLEKETFDAKSEEFKPIHVYGKSFIRENSEHKKIIENIVVFKDDENISISTHSTHNKDIGRFVKQIKTADQIIYADNEISRLASLYLNTGGSHVRLEGINTQVLNTLYNNDNFLSSGREQNLEAVPTLNPSKTKDEQNVSSQIKIVNNKELERVQLFFDDIPPEEQRAELKSHGWHWSPKNKAWQRKNTENALANAKEFAAKFYPETQKPTKTMQAEPPAAKQTAGEPAPEPKPTEADREHFRVAAGSDLQKAVYDLVNKDYWIVASHETSPFNQEKFDGTIVTEELLRELQKLDQDQYEYNHRVGFNEDGSINDAYTGNSKFYFDHVVNGETVEQFRISIGDGVDATREDFEHLYTAIGVTPEKTRESSNETLVQKEKEPNITGESRGLIKFDEFLSETAAARIKNIPELKEVIKEIGSKPLYQNDALFKFVKGGDFIITLASDYAKYTGLKVFDGNQEQEKLIALLQKNNIAVESYADWQKRITSVTPTHQSINEEHANEVLAPHTQKQIKDIRSQAKEILKKPDAEITDSRNGKNDKRTFEQ